MSSTRTSAVLRIVHGAATDPGRVRDHNEDTFGVDLARGLFVVADGLGGHQAGEVASAVAVERFLAAMPSDAVGEDRELEHTVVGAVLEAHRAVVDATTEHPERAGMGTTLVAVWVPGGNPCMWMVNVGDSCGYLLRHSSLIQLSVGDSALESLRRAGALPLDQSLWPPRQQLTQALGPGGTVTPHVARVDLASGDRLLLCSDGLTDMVEARAITEVLERSPEPQAACDALVDAANQAGGIDNTTAVVVDIRANDQAPPT